MRKVLVVAPHPDDETLGCGGTLLKHSEQGEELYWLIMTKMFTTEGYNEETIEARNKEIAEVSRRYGFREVFLLDQPVARLDSIPMRNLIQEIRKLISRLEAEVIYLPYRGDVHSDHRVTFDAMSTAVKTFRYPCVRKIMAYEVVSETEFSLHEPFNPNSFSDITGYLEGKISIMGLYQGETASHPFPRSIENIRALATFRGATAGVRYAEAFSVIKEMW
jgi:N-acetylglucosamine malate deacetylase 1